MLNLSRTVRVFLALQPTDMRKGFDGLLALVQNVIDQDPFSGHLLVFRNQRRDRLKILWWDQDGLAIFYKRLERGSYQFPMDEERSTSPGSDSSQTSALRCVWSMGKVGIVQQSLSGSKVGARSGGGMARLSRGEVFSPDEVAIVHVMNRVVRRCFLLGDDPLSGKNYNHRKLWVETLLRRFAGCFGIDLLGFAILSNHFHLILRSRPDVVQTWDDTEVARRWLLLCPIRKDGDGQPEEPNEMELNTIRNDHQKLETIRLRLGDIAWWMRLLCQNIAMRANFEDGEVGRFWQNRFRAVRLLDEAAILACAAYVDLNPIRAAMAETLEQSDYTSVQRRIESLDATVVDTPVVAAAGTTDDQPLSDATATTTSLRGTQGPDRFLSPVSLEEFIGTPGPNPSGDGFRCSDKGFLPMSLPDYLSLLDWTARQLHGNKRRRTPMAVKPILERLGLRPSAWSQLVGQFGRLFINVAGKPQTVSSTRSRIGQHRYHLRKEARELLSAE
ncbi:IS66 family insertion sequence element accessory protein TnpB [Schlesneria sp.]|uniref:IS66 family insertion sequence element accessory protein TnpB n=1 Tax=Schlesneria sp. TaxID=2762018 RepID=UPI002F0DB4A1